MRNTFAGINATHSRRKLAICGISKGKALDGLLGSSQGSQTAGETERKGEGERQTDLADRHRRSCSCSCAVAVACSLCVSNPSTSSTNSHVSVRCDAVAARSVSAVLPLPPNMPSLASWLTSVSLVFDAFNRFYTQRTFLCDCVRFLASSFYSLSLTLFSVPFSSFTWCFPLSFIEDFDLFS